MGHQVFRPFAFANVPKTVNPKGYIKFNFQNYGDFKEKARGLIEEYGEVTLHRCKLKKIGEFIEYWNIVNNEPTITKTAEI